MAPADAEPGDEVTVTRRKRDKPAPKVRTERKVDPDIRRAKAAQRRRRRGLA